MSPTTALSRRAGRREAIIDAATLLFSARGYADTGIDDIGAAVGVTGPAVYRHFDSKEELLVAVLERAVDHSEAILPRVRAEATSPEDALRRLVEYSVDSCIGDRTLTALLLQHSSALPQGPRTAMERAQRRLIEEYAEILREVRSDLTPSEARMAVYAATALMRAVAQRESSLSADRLQTLLASMAHAALTGASGASPA
jgi:AcrR family transcriptional regulator